MKRTHKDENGQSRTLEEKVVVYWSRKFQARCERENKKSMGYYQIVTSELTMGPLEVIDKYHGLTQIEDQFRVMKGDLDTRPFYVRMPEHIDAHMLIGMISLILLRIIQKRISGSGLIRTLNVPLYGCSDYTPRSPQSFRYSSIKFWKSVSNASTESPS